MIRDLRRNVTCRERAPRCGVNPSAPSTPMATEPGARSARICAPFPPRSFCHLPRSPAANSSPTFSTASTLPMDGHKPFLSGGTSDGIHETDRVAHHGICAPGLNSDGALRWTTRTEQGVALNSSAAARNCALRVRDQLMGEWLSPSSSPIPCSSGFHHSYHPGGFARRDGRLAETPRSFSFPRQASQPRGARTRNRRTPRGARAGWKPRRRPFLAGAGVGRDPGRFPPLRAARSAGKAVTAGGRWRANRSASAGERRLVWAHRPRLGGSRSARGAPRLWRCCASRSDRRIPRRYGPGR